MELSQPLLGDRAASLARSCGELTVDPLAGRLLSEVRATSGLIARWLLPGAQGTSSLARSLLRRRPSVGLPAGLARERAAPPDSVSRRAAPSTA
jgi:hypothetical protein